jgi:RimJ/RimL family protein N-acetyltransferase
MLLEGRNIRLRVAEKDDIPLLARWLNDAEFQGEHQDFPTQISETQLKRRMFEPQFPQMQWVDFIIEKKDGKKIGWTAHYISSPNFGWMEIGCALIPSERGKGYGTEAVQVMVDYLFLTRENLVRIQAVTNTKNVAFQRVLEKIGFKKEGMLRKALFVRGKWTDGYMIASSEKNGKNQKY